MPECRAEGGANFFGGGTPGTIYGSEAVESIFFDAIPGEAIGGVLDGGEAGIGFGEREIAARVLVVPDAFDAFCVVGVIMILVNGADDFGDVDNGGAEGVGFADEPVIPPDAADDERRNLLVQATGEKEVVDVVTGAEDAVFFCEGDDALLPIGQLEIERFGDVRIPATADHQMIGIPGGECAMGVEKIVSENDVAVGVANGLVFRDLLRAMEDGVEAFGAECGAKDFGFMARAEFAGDLGGAVVVTEENDFHVGMEELPGVESVALDHVDVANERLGAGENREHVVEIFSWQRK